MLHLSENYLKAVMGESEYNRLMKGQTSVPPTNSCDSNGYAVLGTLILAGAYALFKFLKKTNPKQVLK